jgi:NitT/TauT family transport system substrate-binding protein
LRNRTERSLEKETIVTEIPRRSFLIGAMSFATIAGAAKAETLQPVRFLVPVKAMDESWAPATAAKMLGFFQQEGLDVSFLLVGGSNEAAVQVGAGNGDIGGASPGQAIVGMQPDKHLDVRYFFDILYSNIWRVSVPSQSPITTINQLKGKRLGVTAMGSAGITFGRAYFKAAGMDQESDIAFIPIGVGAQAMTSVKQGMVDGIVFWDAAIAKFESNGLSLRDLPLPKEVVDLPDVSLLAREDTLKNKPKMLIGFARALAKGYDFCIANPEAAIRILWHLYPESRPAQLPEASALSAGINALTTRMKIWDNPKAEGNHGFFIERDWQALVDFLLAQKVITTPVPVERIYTNEFITEINRYDRDGITAGAKRFDVATLK